jgi:hypothetical protein
MNRDGLPSIGKRRDEYSADCSFGTIEGGTDPKCPKRATWHIAAITCLNPEEMGSLVVCDDHYALAREAASYGFIQQHPYEGVCGLPGTLWDTKVNRCVLDDGTLVKAGAVEEMATA